MVDIPPTVWLMASKTILVVEDEAPIREMLAFSLQRAGFAVHEAADCASAMRSIADRKPDLVLVDWMLPDASGLELTRSLRRGEVNQDLPIIMLTARTGEQDKILGLDSGADDYVTKPYSSRELLARIKALLRRTAAEKGEVIEAGDLRVDLSAHRVFAAGQPVALGPREYQLLVFLMRHPDRVYSRSQLLDHVWGEGIYVEERTVDVHVRRVRKALEEFSADGCLQTVRGAGYRFSVD